MHNACRTCHLEYKVPADIFLVIYLSYCVVFGSKKWLILMSLLKLQYIGATAVPVAFTPSLVWAALQGVAQAKQAWKKRNAVPVTTKEAKDMRPTGRGGFGVGQGAGRNAAAGTALARSHR